MKRKALILTILLIGAIFRFSLTSNGNFLFNIDNARDMVDVREMIVGKKLRLTGPTSAVEGLSNGPAWYYLLSITFILSSGHPYGSIVMQIVLWMIGGIFLLILTNPLGIMAMMSAGFLWIASNFIVLASVYAFNPNPVLFLAPLLIFLINKYITTQKLIYSILMWFLAGLFFNFEMNYGIFVPIIIVCNILFSRKIGIFKHRHFWIGSLFFVLCLLPQFIFDLRHNFIMTRGIITHLSTSNGQAYTDSRLSEISKAFYNVFVPTIFNQEILARVLIFLLPPFIFIYNKQRKNEPVLIIALSMIFIPFFLYLLLPVAVNPWHLDGSMAASVIVISFLLKKFLDTNFLGKVVALMVTVLILYFSSINISKFFLYDRHKPNMDPSLFKNEIAVIDYVYKEAKDRNFKIYTYLPSIIDYPYQYLIWWYGLKEFGYLPKDYAYLPNHPPYISNKSLFSAKEDELKKRLNSNLVFLIKEPDRGYTRSGWEGNFIKLKPVSKRMIGSIEIEIREEL